MSLRSLLRVFLLAGMMTVLLSTGCGRAPSQPPQLDESAKAAIKVEDQEVAQQEKAQGRAR